ncbi:MAG: hypothetical protein ABI867_24395 [Kofleriaceae bacterium]
MKLACALAVSLLACGGDGDTITDLEGVYTVATHTQNLTSCDAEGASVTANSPPNLFVKSENFLGQKFVNVNECESVGECQTLAADDSTLHIGQFGFETGSDSAGWTNTSAFASNFAGEDCEATRTAASLTDEGGAIRIEARVSHATFAPGSGSDACPDEAALAATADAPCEQLEVLTATFTADF